MPQVGCPTEDLLQLYRNLSLEQDKWTDRLSFGSQLIKKHVTIFLPSIPKLVECTAGSSPGLPSFVYEEKIIRYGWKKKNCEGRIAKGE
ncbi:hypothetical protein HY285_02340 [Candidatus Peregrinibacteria bacterium]|nr:hypothetical protein [Candidatus Peregrinibacteria bacterium]MBI3816361.1 hypothetical protein [Candidatus Peregrinibacteria bacterium]